MAERNVLVDGGVDNVRTLQSGDTVAKLRRALFADTTTFTSTGSVDVVATNSITANTFISDLGRIEATYSGETANNTNEKNFTLSFGGTTILGAAYDAVNIFGWSIHAQIIRESNSAVRCFAYCISRLQTTQTKYTRITGLSLSSTAYNLQLAVESPAGAGDIIYRFSTGEYIPAP